MFQMKQQLITRKNLKVKDLSGYFEEGTPNVPYWLINYQHLEYLLKNLQSSDRRHVRRANTMFGSDVCRNLYGVYDHSNDVFI